MKTSLFVGVLGFVGSLGLTVVLITFTGGAGAIAGVSLVVGVFIWLIFTVRRTTGMGRLLLAKAVADENERYQNRLPPVRWTLGNSWSHEARHRGELDLYVGIGDSAQPPPPEFTTTSRLALNALGFVDPAVEAAYVSHSVAHSRPIVRAAVGFSCLQLCWSAIVVSLLSSVGSLVDCAQRLLVATLLFVAVYFSNTTAWHKRFAQSMVHWVLALLVLLVASENAVLIYTASRQLIMDGTAAPVLLLVICQVVALCSSGILPSLCACLHLNPDASSAVEIVGLLCMYTGVMMMLFLGSTGETSQSFGGPALFLVSWFPLTGIIASRVHTVDRNQRESFLQTRQSQQREAEHRRVLCAMLPRAHR